MSTRRISHSGVSAEERGRVEAALARAEALLGARSDYPGAAAEFAEGRDAVAATGAPDLEFRSLLGETWALIQAGQVQDALRSARPGPRARRGRRRSPTSTARPSSSDSASAATSCPASRPSVALLDLGARARRSLRACRATCSASTSSTGAPAATAASATGRRRARTSSARSSWPSPPTTGGPPAQAYFQASLVAEREGHWLLARTYAERARGYYEELEDRANVGRLLNNLGGLNFALGNPEQGRRAC